MADRIKLLPLYQRIGWQTLQLPIHFHWQSKSVDKWCALPALDLMRKLGILVLHIISEISISPPKEIQSKPFLIS